MFRRWVLVLVFAAVGLPPTAARSEDSFKITPDVIYGHKAGLAMTFDVVQPAKPNGAGVVFLVSGGWFSIWLPPDVLMRRQSGAPNQFQSIVDAGYTLFLVRHGSGSHFKVPEAVDDVRRAVRFIRLHAADYGVDPGRLGAYGESAGGHLALMLGATGDDGSPDAKDPIDRVSDRVQAVVAIFPPTKIDEFFPLKDRFPALDFDPAQAESMSPLLQVTSDDSPSQLIHGDKDDLVPISNSQRILEAFQKVNVPADLIVIEGAGHGFAGKDRERANEAIVAWFNKYLAAPSKSAAE